MELLIRFRRRLYLHRRIVAACLAALSVLALGHYLHGPPPETRDVVVTTRDVPAGHTLTSHDVAIRAVPPDWLPTSSMDSLDDAVGQVTAVRSSDGTVLQTSQLLSGHQTAAGRAVVPIVVSPGELVAVLAPGTRVTLAHAGQAAEVVTDDAHVVPMPAHSDAGNQLTQRVAQAPLVLVDVPEHLGPSIAALGQANQLAVILGGG